MLDGEARADILRATFAKRASLRLQVKGFSMSPFVRNGDVATLAPLSGEEIGIGRVIAFLRVCDKKLVIHRLIRVRQDPEARYVPKGDNVPSPDDPISRADMLATVEKVERGGRVVSFGLGPERRLIAFLSGMNLFCTLFFFWRLIPFSIRQKIFKVIG